MKKPPFCNKLSPTLNYYDNKNDSIMKIAHETIEYQI